MEKLKPSPEAFQKVVQASELVIVQMKACNAKCHVFPTLVDPAMTHLEIATGNQWNRSEQKDVLLCYIDATVKGTATKAQPGIKEGDALFEAKATVVVVYQLSEKELEDSAIELFASRNALLNGYPFLRETVANLTSRMGIPPVQLPLLKPAARVDGQKSGEQKQVSQQS